MVRCRYLVAGVLLFGCEVEPSPLLMDQLPPPTLILEPQGAAVRGETLEVLLPLPGPVADVPVFLPTSEAGPGNQVCPPILRGQCLSIAGPLEVFGPARSDTDGVVQVEIPVELDAADDLYMQGVVLYNGRVLLSDPLRLDVVDASCATSGGCPQDSGAVDSDSDSGGDTAPPAPSTLTGVAPELVPGAAAEVFDCGFLQPVDGVDPTTGAITNVQVTLDRDAARWFVEPTADAVPSDPRLVLDYGSVSGAPQPLLLSDTSDLSVVTAELAAHTEASSGLLGHADVGVVVRWLDLFDPIQGDQLDLVGLWSTLASGESVGDLGELRATCLVARMVSRTSGFADATSFSTDRFWSRMVADAGGVASDACLWSNPSDASCSGVYDPTDFIHTSLGHPVYGAASWADTKVGVSLPPGQDSPFDAFEDPGFDLTQPGGQLAAGDYANDWTLGGAYVPEDYQWTPQRLLDNERDPLVQQHIHTWALRGDLTGRLNSQSTLVAFAGEVDETNRGCFEPGSLASAEVATCTTTTPAVVHEGCSAGGVEKGFADCYNHPRRFQRRREFHGPGSGECTTATNFNCVETPRLLLTTDWARCERYNTDPALDDWTCVAFPERMRVFHGNIRPAQNSEASAVLRIRGFTEVEIEGLHLDVLPHPMLGTFEELDASPMTGLGKLQNTLTEHIGQSLAGAVAFSSVDAKYATYGSVIGAMPVDGAGGADYDLAWANWRDAMYLVRRTHAAGNVIEVHDIDFLNVHDNALRFLAMESGLQMRSIRAMNIERNWLQGQSFARLKDLGFPVDDPVKGAQLVVDALANGTHTLDEIFMMGSGITVDNNRNGDFTPGVDCCREPSSGPNGSVSIPTCDRDAPSYADGAVNLTEYSGREGYCTAGDACDVQAVYIAQNTIRDCTLERFTDANGQGALFNHDGMVLMNAPGLIFSNELANFALDYPSLLACNALIDVANRRPCDLDWTEKYTRLERNILSAGLIKTEGSGEPQNAVTWANNVMTNVPLQDYHSKWTSWYLHNSYNVTEGATRRFKGYVWSDAAKTAHGWHPAPSMYFGRNSVRFGDRLTVMMQRGNYVGQQEDVQLEHNLMFGYPLYMQSTTIGGNTYKNWANLYDPPVAGASPEVACPAYVGQGVWRCMETYGVPEAELVDAFAMRTTLGSRFTLRNQPEVFIAPDGRTTSSVPEDVLVAMRAEPLVGTNTTPADYAWFVDHEVAPDDQAGLDCASDYAQRLSWTRWLGEDDLGADHNPACNWQTFFGADAFVGLEASEKPASCSSTTTPTSYDGTYVSDLLFVDTDTVGLPGNPYRAALEAHINPFSSASGGMDTPVTTVDCLSGQPGYTVSATDPSTTVRQSVANTLTNHLVSRLGRDEPPWRRVERDFCGTPRHTNTTIGAFEVGSSCPASFSP